MAARSLLSGENPYQVIQPVGDYPFDSPDYYPITAALVALPFAWLPAPLAGGLFFGLSSALLAYALMEKARFRWPLFVSAPFLVATALAQWSPLMLAASLLPAFSWLLACKPNLGIPLFISQPSWRSFLSIAGFVLLSLVVLPGWLLEWRAVVTAPSFHYSPILIGPAGLLLLLSAFRWREPGGRLLFAMALMPQSMWFTDQLVLWAIPRNQGQVWLLTGLSWFAYGLWRIESGGQTPINGAINPGRYILWLIYLPALILALVPEKSSIFPPVISRPDSQTQA